MRLTAVSRSAVSARPARRAQGLGVGARAGVPLFLRGGGPQTLDIAFPHGSLLQSALGAPVPGSAVHDPAACAARGVPAFTDGAVTHFAAPSPALHVAAHEAAHQLQHAGLTTDAGMGAEPHAHAVASAVTGGSNARGFLGRPGNAVAPAVRNYTDISTADQTTTGQWSIGSAARVADNGRAVTSVSDRHVCYADPALIDDANLILRAKKSGVQLRAGSAGPTGDAPDGSGARTTVAVVATVASESGGENWADCGRMSREVQGPAGTDSPTRGVYTDTAGGAQHETPTGTYAPTTIRDEVLVAAGLGATPAAARAAYLAMTDAQREAFDQAHGINRYAAPNVGESFVSARNDDLTNMGYNFHWGGVILVAGGDRVTLENFARAGTTYDTQNALWYFDMYGPPTKAGQTWHDRWAEAGGREGTGVGEPGMNSMTMTARTSADPSPWTRAALTMSTADLIRRYAATSEPGERMAMEAEMRTRWLKVTVEVVSAQEGPDEVFVTAEHGGRSYRSSDIDLDTGDRNTFWVSLDRLAPVSGPIIVKAYDWDLLSANDMISHIRFQDPFTPTVDDQPWDDATYRTTVELDR